MWVWIPIVSSLCGFILLVCVLAIPIAIISKRRSAKKQAQQPQVAYSGTGAQPVTHNSLPPPPDYANNPPPPDYAGGTKDSNYSPV